MTNQIDFYISDWADFPSKTVYPFWEGLSWHWYYYFDTVKNKW